ncbi:MAG: 2Fe-2S iron-sulfur cluster-binding protein [Cyanobacteria bacterium P01_G01_bin.4]
MSYSVRLINAETGLDKTIAVPEGEYILDVAEDTGIDIPYSCRAGKCISCVGRVESGVVKQDHDFLKDSEVAAGFVLTCMAAPRSDCVIYTEQEDALLDL